MEAALQLCSRPKLRGWGREDAPGAASAACLLPAAPFHFADSSFSISASSLQAPPPGPATLNFPLSAAIYYSSPLSGQGKAGRLGDRCLEKRHWPWWGLPGRLEDTGWEWSGQSWSPVPREASELSLRPRG